MGDRNNTAGARASFSEEDPPITPPAPKDVPGCQRIDIKEVRIRWALRDYAHSLSGLSALRGTGQSAINTLRKNPTRRIGDASLRPVSPSARKSNAMAPKWHGGGTACPISGGKCGDCAVRNRSTCGVYVLSGDNPITRRSRSALRRDRRNFRPTKHVGGRLGSLWRNRPSLQSGTIR